MQHLLLIRHGQTDANARGVIQGHLPTSLNPLGREQSRRLGERLRGYTPRLDRIVSSPLVRAVETAEIVSEIVGLPVETDDAWVERHFGAHQGTAADLLQIMTHGGHRKDADDAEPKHAFDRRIRDALEAIFAMPSPGTGAIAVVTHGGVIGSVVRQLISGGIACVNPPAERSAVPNCSILHLRRPVGGGGALEVVRLHDAAHLADLTTDLDAG